MSKVIVVCLQGEVSQADVNAFRAAFQKTVDEADQRWLVPLPGEHGSPIHINPEEVQGLTAQARDPGPVAEWDGTKMVERPFEDRDRVVLVFTRGQRWAQHVKGLSVEDVAERLGFKIKAAP